MISKIGDYFQSEFTKEGALFEADTIEATLLTFPSRIPIEVSALLDLGCGAEDDAPSFGEDRMPPNLCDRASSYGWTSVTGIDHRIDTTKKRPWTAKKVDLMDRGVRRAAMPLKTYDLVVSNYLISTSRPEQTSPSLTLPSGRKPYSEFESSQQLAQDPEYVEFLWSFFSDISRTLKVGGVFLLNRNVVFIKRLQGLEPVTGRPLPPISQFTLNFNPKSGI